MLCSNNGAVTATRYFCITILGKRNTGRATLARDKWIGVVFRYSDLFHLVSRGQTRRNLWGLPGGKAGLIGLSMLPGLFSKTCGRL